LPWIRCRRTFGIRQKRGAPALKFYRRCMVDHLAILPDVEELVRRKIQGRREQGRRELLDAGVVCLHCIGVTEAHSRV
jgi:hypothetical protein